MKEHDPDAKVGMVHSPEDPDDDTGDVHLFHHVPITEKARQSIIKNGFKAYRRGGEVERASKAGGGGMGGNGGPPMDDFGDWEPIDEKRDEHPGVPSIPAIREGQRLQKFHNQLWGDIADRVAKAHERGLQYHESGKLPFAVGTRFHTSKSKKLGQAPYEVTSHYVDHRDPNTYGYGYRRHNEDGDEETGHLHVSNPKADERIRKWEPDWDRDAHVAQWQPLGGLRRVKNKGGSLGDGNDPKWRTVIGGSGPKVSETSNPKRILFHAEGPGGVKGIIVPRHTWEGGNGKFGRLAGLAEINQARAQVYGPEPRAPLNVGQIEKAHKAALDEHFSMPIPHQIAAENAALERLRAAKHISGGADTLDEGEKLDTVKHEYDPQGRSYVAYGAKGTAGHALYSSGTGDEEKIHVLNTCSGQTNGCGGGIDKNGIVDTRRGTCFAPKAEGQYAGAAIRRAAHEQAKHDPAMTKDWVLAHTGSLRNAAQRADKTNNVVLFRPNVLDETDRSTRHVLKGLNRQRIAQGLPPIIANSYGKTNELHDPENGYFITHSNIGPKVKHGASIQENIGKDRQRIRSTIMAADAGGRDFRNEEGHLTPPKNSYMVSDVARDSPMDAALQQAITHAKYWSAPREQHELSAAERAEGPEGHFGPNGQPVAPHMSHFGHTTLNGRRYDYQRQHILHPRYVKVGVNDDGSDHMIPTDSRFKDDEFLPKNRFMTKNGKRAGAILFTTPTKSTSGVERQSSFTHHVGKAHIEHALQNNGEYEVDTPHDQERARGKEYEPPVNPAGKYAHGGAVLGDDEIEGTAFPSQSFCAQRHLAHRADEDPLPPQPPRAKGGGVKTPARTSDIVTRALGVIPRRV